MKIASWNVNSIKQRLGHVLRWLETEKPDALLLQELKGLEFPFAEIEAAGYKAHAVPQKGRNGVALLTPHEAKIVLDRLPGDDADEEARYIEADIDGLRIIGIYAPNGNPVDSEKFPYKLVWLSRLKDRLAVLREKDIAFVICGDFNIIPEDKDCADPEGWRGDALFRPESLAKYRSICHLGLTDAFRVFNRAGGEYTFWDYQAGAWPRNNGIRIDHFLLCPEAADRLQSCRIDKGPRGWEQPSDHTPILVELGWKKAA